MTRIRLYLYSISISLIFMLSISLGFVGMDMKFATDYHILEPFFQAKSVILCSVLGLLLAFIFYSYFTFYVLKGIDESQPLYINQLIKIGYIVIALSHFVMIWFFLSLILWP